MNISIYLEAPLAKKTQQYADKMGTTRNAIIREAVKVWIIQHEVSVWPKSVLNFEGVYDFPPFEEGRDNFVAPIEELRVENWRV